MTLAELRIAVKKYGLKELYDFLAQGVLQTSTPVNAVASEGIMTIGAQPTATDIATIGGSDYLFVADGEEADEGDISVGTDLATAKANILAAIAGSDSINTANAEVTASAFSTDESTLTAKVKGVAGDLIATTSTFASGSNLFDGTTLGTETAGVDGTVGVAGEGRFDASYEYRCIADNTIADTNWRRFTLGSAY